LDYRALFLSKLVCKEFYHFARFELRIRKEVIKPNDIYIKKNTLLKQNQMEEA